jgi:hypothetical protein
MLIKKPLDLRARRIYALTNPGGASALYLKKVR